MKKTVIIMKHIYLAEVFLACGNTPYIPAGYHINKPMREKYIKEFELEFEPHSKKYIGDPDLIFKYFQNKYPEKLQQLGIKSYHELVYRALD